MVSGYEVGMYRDIGRIADYLRSLAEEVGRLADAQQETVRQLERANELADLVEEVGETPDQ